MQLLSLKLNNIRSYTNATIEFPNGIVLLSGDIGSGKSTILLGIEFALFGLLRGELSGSALLRNGAQEGSCELTFNVNNTIHAVKRTIKRTKTGVEQTAGYIITNGIKKEATATELKSAILELLGYPEEMLSKNKNFIFRYTVYTPQEDMKKILTDTSEERTALLRKVFDIDKYSRISQNLASYAKFLREKKRGLDIATADLGEKRKQATDYSKEIEDAKNQSETLAIQIATAKSKLEDLKQKIGQIEQQRKNFENLNRELHTVKTQIISNKQNQRMTEAEIITATSQLNALSIEISKETDTKELASKNIQLHTLLAEKEKTARQESMQFAEHTAMKRQSNESAQKIISLAKCPTCLQEVPHEHKNRIITAEREKLKLIEETILTKARIMSSIEQEITAIKAELETIRAKEKDAAIAKVKKAQSEELAKRKKLLEEKKEAYEKSTAALEIPMLELESKLKAIQSVHEDYQKIKNELDETLNLERALSIQHSTFVQKEQYAKKILVILLQDIERKEKSLKEIQKNQNVHQFVTDYMIPLMDVMEKHTMAKIKQEFDALFRQWFSMLIEDLMSARLDENFTPIIQQNGYDTEVENLSGGEKTACALAFRLALNKTINSLVSSIRTKDLIILDEPTDGFSAEQLDKMREVINQLKLNQIIIVSHEQKIEGFADKVIHIKKDNHVSCAY